MSNITLLILEVFFGAFTINGCLKFYGKKAGGLLPIHLVMWFISAIIFAITSGLIFR